MSSLNELQTVSKKITDALQLKIEKANFLADDLAFLIEKSSKLARELEEAKGLRIPEPGAAKPVVIPAKPKPAFEPKALFETQAPKEPAAAPKSAKSASTYTPVDAEAARTAQSLEAILQRLAAPGALAEMDAKLPVRPVSQGGMRTEAERELQAALKSGQS
jgi:hypothetical protein